MEELDEIDNLIAALSVQGCDVMFVRCFSHRFVGVPLNVRADAAAGAALGAAPSDAPKCPPTCSTTRCRWCQWNVKVNMLVSQVAVQVVLED